MKENECARTEVEEPPGHGTLPHPWRDVPLAQWADWRWRLSRRLNTVQDFARVIHFTPEEVEGLSSPGLFREELSDATVLYNSRDIGSR